MPWYIWLLLVLVIGTIIGGLLMVFAYGQVRGRIGTVAERDKRMEAELKAAKVAELA